MKKTIVQIKDLQWYESNCNEHGIVYLNPEDDSNFFSRGQSTYCGKITEITHEDSNGNIRLAVDKGEWLWKKWQFDSIEEKEVNDDIIDVDYNNEEYITEEETPKPILIEDRSEKNTLEFKMNLIKQINDYKLNYLLGTAISNIILADKNNTEQYKHLLETSIVCIQSELHELDKETKE